LIEILRISRIAALLSAVVVMGGVALTPSANAETSQHTTRLGTIQMAKSPFTPVNDKLKSPGKRAGKQCNGKTTTECCAGISYCGCFYFPGSSDATHPTSCKSSPPSNG
jgi:hypothetical protein